MRLADSYDATMTNFLLILRGDADADLSDHSPAEIAALLDEYEQWAAALGDRVISVEKATPRDARVIGRDGAERAGPHGDAADVVSGFYVIKADDLDQAAGLCAGHPCLRFGSIEVRELQPNGASAAADAARGAGA